MSNYRAQPVAALHDFTTGALIGFLGADGREYLLPVSAAFAANAQAGTAYPGNFTTLTASSTVSGAGFTNYLASPPSIGTTTPGVVRASNLQFTYSDGSGTPGNITLNAPRGRVGIAAAASSIIVTNNLTAATSTVLAVISQATADATLTQIVRVTPAAGSFTIIGNAAATATTVVDYVVLN